MPVYVMLSAGRPPSTWRAAGHSQPENCGMVLYATASPLVRRFPNARLAMKSTLSPEQLARSCARRPWFVVGLWLVLILACGVLSSQLASVLTSEQDFTNEPESKKAQVLLEERLRGPEHVTEIVIVQSADNTVDSSQFRTFVGKLAADLRAIGDGLIANVTTFQESNNAGLVSKDRKTTIVPVQTTSRVADAPDDVGPLLDVVHEANGRDGFRVLSSGVGSFGHESNELSEKDIQRGESIGVPIALAILIVVLGALIAAGLPVVLAFVGITVALGATFLVGQAFDLSFFVQNMITMIGLAVGIDYSLFIIQRYREERFAGLSKQEAIEKAGATASRAVLFSGITVVLALFGMLLVPNTIFRSLGIGAILVVVAAVLAALTLLPAILSLLDGKVNALRVPFLGKHTPQADAGFWARAARIVMGHPFVSIILAVVVLVAAAIPYFSADFGFSGTDTFPKETESYQAFEILDREFNVGLLTPAEIVIDSPNVNSTAVQTGITKLRELLATDPQNAFGDSSVETNPSGNLALVSVPVRGEASSQQALDAIERVRHDYVPQALNGTNAKVFVGGLTAGNQDFFELAHDYQPIVFAAVLSLSFLLLMMVFRSIVVPAKAILMNLLSVGAAYGLIVAVFQRGFLNDIFGFQQVEKIEAWLPLFLFSVLFGLSMDYHVFLLSRIRERYDETHNNSEAVAHGLRSTASIITGAALIMVAVFSGFAAGQFVFLQQMGFGLAVAVIVDATIIRTILVPASMQILGEWNWYLPSWLAWLPKIQVEGQRTGQPVVAEEAR